jgi:hypothetical protein
MNNKQLLIYVSGKITGLQDLNKPKFAAAEKLIRAELGGKGVFVWVCNPHDLPDHDHDKTWASYMRECLKALCVCNRIYVLDDWKKSRGAVMEVLVALVLGIPVYEVATMSQIKVKLAGVMVKLLTLNRLYKSAA